MLNCASVTHRHSVSMLQLCFMSLPAYYGLYVDTLLPSVTRFQLTLCGNMWTSVLIATLQHAFKAILFYFRIWYLIINISALEQLCFYCYNNIKLIQFSFCKPCVHVWACRQLCVVSGEKVKVEKYSSVGLDGAMVIWNFKVHVSNYKCEAVL